MYNLKKNVSSLITLMDTESDQKLYLVPKRIDANILDSGTLYTLNSWGASYLQGKTISSRWKLKWFQKLCTAGFNYPADAASISTLSLKSG